MPRMSPPVPWRAALLATVLAVSLVAPGPQVPPPAPPVSAYPPAPASPRDPLRTPNATSGESTAPSRDAAADAPPLAGPTIEYEQAMEHAADAPDADPGGTVSAGFVPTPDAPDVDGGRALALPAAAATGRQMAAEQNGAVWADGRPDALAAAPPARSLAARPVAASAAAPDVQPVAFASSRRQVFGFLPYWKLGTARLRHDVLTTIAYFGVGATSTGHLAKRSSSGRLTPGWAGWTGSRMTSIIRIAHRTHVRVVLTVQMFAWTAGQTAAQVALLRSPSRRARLATEIVAAVRDRGADGVNLDFEPIAAGESLDFVRFVRTLRARLSAVHRGYELTVDTTGYIGNYDVTRLTAPGAADAVVVMGYDYRTASSQPGSIAPLSRAGYDLRDTIQAYLARTGAKKIILGLPWYGRAWSTASKRLGAVSVSAAKYGRSSAATYAVAAALAKKNGRHYAKAEATAWTAYRKRTCTTLYGCATSWRTLYYDDARSLGSKLWVINHAGLRGTAIWALGYDGSSNALWDVYARSFRGR